MRQEEGWDEVQPASSHCFASLRPVGALVGDQCFLFNEHKSKSDTQEMLSRQLVTLTDNGETKRWVAESIQFSSWFTLPCRGGTVWASVCIFSSLRREKCMVSGTLVGFMLETLVSHRCQPEITSSLEQKTRIPPATSSGKVEGDNTSSTENPCWCWCVCVPQAEVRCCCF